MVNEKSQHMSREEIIDLFHSLGNMFANLCAGIEKRRDVGTGKGHRDGVIQRLKRELKQRCRDSAAALQDTDTLLPPPTQAELAKIVGASAPTITRAFQDSPELRVMLDGLEDYQFVSRMGAH